ncbi:11949_t:CDS:2 [Dentiscutata erythropus]|uniref:11949_t:CDS:1 n=1 Tax=Dentiscutata erythropus TaxID=1348616 RepID=A0A9N9CSI1_9GLOM|nr:11949_t:CDS:2 [Dentiscutata erythropus]
MTARQDLVLLAAGVFLHLLDTFFLSILGLHLPHREFRTGCLQVLILQFCQASLKPNNEFNKLIEAVISSDLEQLPENEPLRSWYINADAIPPIVFNQFPSEFKQLRMINKYRFILPDDIKIWFENSWEMI